MRNIFLAQAAAPKRWKAYDGRYTEMDTKYTIRAKEMRDIYNSINMKYLTQDERLDVLLTLKHTVKVTSLQKDISSFFVSHFFGLPTTRRVRDSASGPPSRIKNQTIGFHSCLLYTSDAADE